MEILEFYPQEASQIVLIIDAFSKPLNGSNNDNSLRGILQSSKPILPLQRLLVFTDTVVVRLFIFKITVELGRMDGIRAS